MRHADVTYAYRVAGALADEVAMRLPDSFALDCGELFSLVLPLAVRLAVAERKAARNRKHAKAYRRARRDIRQLLEASRQAPVPPQPARPAWADFRACDWHVALVPGPALEREREAA